ncbi:MAG: PAS domain S-box protein, partial [Thermomicrobiales bacterium]
MIIELCPLFRDVVNAVPATDHRLPEIAAAPPTGRHPMVVVPIMFDSSDLAVIRKVLEMRADIVRGRLDGPDREGSGIDLIIVDEAALGNPHAVAQVAMTRRIAGGRCRPDVLALVDGPSSNGALAAMDLGVDEIVFRPLSHQGLILRLEGLELRRLRRDGVTLVDREGAEQRCQDLLTQAERQANELRLMHGVREALSNDLSLEAMFSRVVDHLATSFGHSHVGLYALEHASQLVLPAQFGYHAALDRLPVTRGVMGRVVRSGRAVLIEDVHADREFLPVDPAITSEVCAPFFRRGELAGVLNVERAGSVRLGASDLRIVIAVAGYLSLAMERVELQAAVRSGDERLRIAMDAAGMGSWHWNPSTGVVEWSKQMPEIYGLGPDVLQLPAADWFALIHPDDREHVGRNQRLIETVVDQYEVEFRIVLPSGATRWLSAKGKVLEREPSGAAVRVVGVTMDVTGRKRMEEERLRLVQAESARTEVEESQRRLTDTLERMTAAFIAVDRGWRLTYANQRALSLIGQTLEEASGRPLWKVFSDWLPPLFEKELRRAARTQRSAQFEMALPSINRWIEVHVYPAAEGLSLYLYDVTERKIADEERRRIEERFRSLVQNASDIILILDRDAKVRDVSPAVERVFGSSADDVVGADNFARVHPQDSKRLRRAFFKVAKQPGVSQPFVLRFRDSGGGYRWLEVTATNLFHDPAINGIIANCRDVTERHEAEFNLWFLSETSAVLGSSLDLETTLINLSRLVVSHLADFCVVQTIGDGGEPERVVVAHRDPALEPRLAALVTGRPLDPNSPYGAGYAVRSGRSMLYASIDDDMQAMLVGSKPLAAEYDALAYRSAVVAPLIARGGPIGVVTIASARPHRFTPAELGLAEEMARRAALAIENAQLYRASRHAVEVRDQFLSVAAHELRTPITALTGFASLLQREVATRNDPDQVERYMRRLNEAGGRLALLVDDMLDVSRIRLGPLPLRLETLDLVGLVGQVLRRYGEYLSTDRHDLKIALPDGTGVILGDADRLEQVMTNLLDNAVKYSPAGGQILVSVLGVVGGYEIAVRDSGIGLPAGEIEAIFLPFGRAANAQHSHLPGLRIGLSICSTIVERHG